MDLGIIMITDGHLDREEIEQYSLGLLPEVDSAPIEEHLLTCENCRSRVEDSDAFIAAIRAAGKLMESSEHVRKYPQAAKSAANR
ncbi:MAG TPA: hypothetical protein VML19_01385 [Verrucomicrobiae bacterium]|nr:hypothetical protein [Verrucomicrobiae bacterium]